MEELFSLISHGGLLGATAAIATGLIALAALLPKLLNAYKGDQLTGNVLDRIRDLELKSDGQDRKIHRAAVRVTKLVVVVIRLEALLVDNHISIPQDLVSEIQSLRKDTEAE